MHNHHTIVGGARSFARIVGARYCKKHHGQCYIYLQNYNEGVNYYVALDVEFKKMLEDTFTDPQITFRTEVYRLLKRALTDINGQATEIIETLNNSFDTFIGNGSGWIFKKFGRMQLKMFDYRPMACVGGTQQGFSKHQSGLQLKRQLLMCKTQIRSVSCGQS
eukprot:gene12565-3262_t